MARVSIILLRGRCRARPAKISVRGRQYYFLVWLLLLLLLMLAVDLYSRSHPAGHVRAISQSQTGMRSIQSFIVRVVETAVHPV